MSPFCAAVLTVSSSTLVAIALAFVPKLPLLTVTVVLLAVMSVALSRSDTDPVVTVIVTLPLAADRFRPDSPLASVMTMLPLVEVAVRLVTSVSMPSISFLADKVTTALALVAVMSLTASPASLIEPFWLVIDTALVVVVGRDTGDRYVTITSDRYLAGTGSEGRVRIEGDVAGRGCYTHVATTGTDVTVGLQCHILCACDADLTTAGLDLLIGCKR